MISKLIKTIFGKKEKTAENPQKSNTPQSSDDGELTNDKNSIDFDFDSLDVGFPHMIRSSM